MLQLQRLSAMLSPLLLLCIGCITYANAAENSTELPLVGNACNPNNTRLLVDNNQLTSDCGYVAWCDSTDNICKVKGCRKDEWPFGFNKVQRHLWPQYCSSEQFCPDEGSFCMNKIALGQQCQLGRDDECAVDPSGSKVKCLRNTCVAVNATLGLSCIYENTIYTDFTDRNNNYGDIISRDNCLTGMFCDSPTAQCKTLLAKGFACSADKECVTGYCSDPDFLATTIVNNNATGFCGDNLNASNPKPWVYALVVIIVLALIFITSYVLIRIHMRQTKKRKLAREEYWQDQRSISEKARLIDGMSRSGTPISNSRHPLLSARDSSPSCNSSQSNTVHRNGYKSVSRRFSENSTAIASRLDSLAHPLQQHLSVNDTYMRYDNDSDLTKEKTASTPSPNSMTKNPSYTTPPQSSHSHTHNTSSMGASTQSRAYDPFGNDANVRSRDARSRHAEGWQSPDMHVGEERRY